MKKESVFTNITYWLGIVAFGVQFIVGLTYVFSETSFDHDFGKKCLMEGFFALIGILLIDIIRGNKFRLKPEQFRKYDYNSLWRAGVILATLYGTQLITFFIPMTVRDSTMALAIVFAGICEEIFFRGFILTLFIQAGKNDLKKFKIPLSKKEIGVIEIIGIFVSSLLFALIHTNYYDQPALILALFLSGFIIGFLYVLWEDLTACIFGHFLLNFIWSIQTYGFWFLGVVNL